MNALRSVHPGRTRASGAPPGAARRVVLQTILAVTVLAGGVAAVNWWLYGRTVAGRLTAQEPYIRRWSAEYGVPADVVRAVIRVESKGNPRAESRRGAKGLMQVTDTAERDVLDRLGIERPRRVRRVVRKPDGATTRTTAEKDLFDPEYNIRVGTAYLGMMLDRFGGDLVLALAAYNMGPSRLAKLRGAHPQLGSWTLVRRHAPGETRRYVRKVCRHLGRKLDS
ncbi:MAG: lytic transglycosylase domain-containing protein [Planctomycetota bacterium]